MAPDTDSSELALTALKALLCKAAASEPVLQKYWFSYVDQWRPSTVSGPERRNQEAAGRLRVFLEALLKWWLKKAEGTRRKNEPPKPSVGSLLTALNDAGHLPLPPNRRGQSDKAWKDIFGGLNRGNHAEDSHRTSRETVTDAEIEQAERNLAELVFEQHEMKNKTGFVLRSELGDPSRREFVHHFATAVRRAREAVESVSREPLSSQVAEGSSKLTLPTTQREDARAPFARIRNALAMLATVVALVGAVASLSRPSAEVSEMVPGSAVEDSDRGAASGQVVGSTDAEAEPGGSAVESLRDSPGAEEWIEARVRAEFAAAGAAEAIVDRTESVAAGRVTELTEPGEPSQFTELTDSSAGGSESLDEPTETEVDSTRRPVDPARVRDSFDRLRRLSR